MIEVTTQGDAPAVIEFAEAHAPIKGNFANRGGFMMSKIGFSWSFVRLIVSMRYILEVSGLSARRLIKDRLGVPPSTPRSFPSQYNANEEAF